MKRVGKRKGQNYERIKRKNGEKEMDEIETKNGLEKNKERQERKNNIKVSKNKYKDKKIIEKENKCQTCIACGK